MIAYGCGMQGLYDRIVLAYFVACGVSRLARYNVTAEEQMCIRDSDSRVCTTGQPRARQACSIARVGATAAARCDTSLPSESPKPPGSMKSRCMSMMTLSLIHI